MITKNGWINFWMRYAGLSPMGRIAARFASFCAPPYKSRCYLADRNDNGYVSPAAVIGHDHLELGRNVFLGDRVTIFKAHQGGTVKLGRGAQLYGDITIETGLGGSVEIGAQTHIQPRCQFSAYQASIKIGSRVDIATNCSFYPYNHEIEADKTIREQGLTSKGDIIIEDDVWIGCGVIVLDGVHIGQGAVIGAGAVVTKNIPDYAVAFGNPARVARMRK